MSEVRAGSSEVRATATDELLPCPFCGGEAELRYHPSCMRDPSHRSWERGIDVVLGEDGIYHVANCGRKVVE